MNKVSTENEEKIITMNSVRLQRNNSGNSN